MNWGWKLFWKVAAGLVIAGFVCCIIAFALGASFDNVVDRYYGEGSSKEFDNIDELDFDVVGKLNIKTHDKDTVRVDVTGGSRRWRVECSQRGSELKIRNRLWFSWIGISNYGTIDVYVPEGYQFKEASISLGAGEADVKGINAKRLGLDIGAGEGTIHDFVADELSMDCGAGKVAASGVLNGDAKIRAGVGWTVLDLKGKEQEFNYDIDCVVGEVEVGNNSYSGLASNRRIDNGADKTIKIDCGVGSVNVDFN